MKRFGLIGRTLKHSFSQKYFSDKFEKEGIKECQYDLFELPDIFAFPNLLSETKGLVGLNVTIPYKLEVMPFLDEMDENARFINAVNTIKVMPDGKLKGFNTDYYGFRNSLNEWDLDNATALILGTGGASNAVKKVLTDLKIPFQMVSRSESPEVITYDTIKSNPSIIAENKLIINTTPVGTFPNVDDCPDLPYDEIGSNHLLFDLVYNPEVTQFMKMGIKSGAKVKNGYEMLVGQAEASWKIWNE